MKKYAILLTSTSGVDYSESKDEFTTMRLTLHCDGKDYVDYTDITADEFYQMMIDNPNADIKTSLISAGVFETKFEELKNEGIKDILVITISSGLSGTYQSAMIAKDMVTDMNIEVFDSLCVSYPELYLAQKASKMLQEGKTLNDVVATLKELRSNTHMFIVVDTLKYLVKNGRLSTISGLIGTILKIKPILTINQNGKIVSLEKIRTTEKAQLRAVELLLTQTKGKKVDYFICYSTNKEKVHEIKEYIEQQVEGANVQVVPLTPVVGAHAGPGTFGLGYVEHK